MFQTQCVLLCAHMKWTYSESNDLGKLKPEEKQKSIFGGNLTRQANFVSADEGYVLSSEWSNDCPVIDITVNGFDAFLQFICILNIIIVNIQVTAITSRFIRPRPFHFLDLQQLFYF